MGLQKINSLVGTYEHEIDALLADFHAKVRDVASNKVLANQMDNLLTTYNPHYIPPMVETNSSKAEILAKTVAGIYAPMIHAFSATLLKNVQLGKVPPHIAIPPRDAIPIAVSLTTIANIKGIKVNIFMPHINRNTAGISNNQKNTASTPDPLLPYYFDQLVGNLNGHFQLAEAETGIYGTTSYVMAEEFKKRGIKEYVPLKLYALGPNLSFIHSILSEGKHWIAEEMEDNTELVNGFMVILDTMEELGMQNVYKSVECLQRSDEGKIIPVIHPVSPEETEVARVTNNVVKQTAPAYANPNSKLTKHLIENLFFLLEKSKEGFPFTLTSAIPPMHSKQEHFNKIRQTKIFDYPILSL